MRTPVFFWACICLFLSFADVQAQCGTGYTSVALNWDELDFKTSNTVSQKYTMGKHQLEFTYTLDAAVGKDGVAGSFVGVNNANVATSSMSVNFKGNVTITLKIQPAISNLAFSVYDVDNNQKLDVTATDGATNRAATLSSVGATTVLNAPTSSGNTYSIQAKNTSAADNTNNGTVNVAVAGPVSNVVVKLSATEDVKGSTPEAGNSWISDISGCTTSSFATNYHNVSQPYAGQPGYVLVARNNTVYMTDPATGRSVDVFTDPSSKNINSMGYDPVKRILYFTYSLTGTNGAVNPANKEIKKYDFNTNTLSTWVSDITASPLKIPSFGSGVESGGASFYDGHLYIGITGDATGFSTVWRIDIDATGAATGAVQVKSIATSGHDWGDFAIKNGVLYDFDGKAGAENIYHFNLSTATTTNTYGAPLGFGIRQVAVDWNGQILNIGGAPAATGEVAPYNGTGGITATSQKTITVGTTSPSGSWGDAAESFKPKSDFGDAPAGFDPVASSPALHDIDVNLRLGATIDYEWSKSASASADSDGGDEDGLPFVRILTNGTNYYTDVNVFNNTGSNATVAAWVDFNRNNIFETGEGVSKTVASNASMQTVQLFWPSSASALAPNSSTFLRIRVSTSGSMSTSTPTGYFFDGEVEDYYVVVNSVTLNEKLHQFTAVKKNDQQADVAWVVQDEEKGTRYELQKSSDAANWQTVDSKTVFQPAAQSAYRFSDLYPYPSQSYYRLKMTNARGKVAYSMVEKVVFAAAGAFSVYPNPASTSATFRMILPQATNGQLQVADASGHALWSQQLSLKAGVNNIVLPVGHLPNGLYHIQVATAEKTYRQSIAVKAH